MRVVAIAGTVTLVLCLGIGALFGPVLMNWWTLQQSSKRTVGVVVDVNPNQHNSAVYAYTVEGKDYQASHLGFRGAVGDVVTVYYSPTRPQLSMLGNPETAFRRGVVGTGIVFIFVGAAVLFATLRATR